MKLNTKTHTPDYNTDMITKQICLLATVLCLIQFLQSCNSHKPSAPTQIVSTPEQIEGKIPDLLKEMVGEFTSSGKLEDSIGIAQPLVLQYLYDKNEYTANWSRRGKWTLAADSLMHFIEEAKLYGLFPEDYHLHHIETIRQRIANDTSAQGPSKDAKLWSRADVLLSDALVQIIKDIKLGRLQKDSITLRTDSTLPNEFYEEQVQKVIQSFTISRIIQSLEPTIKGYQELRAGLRSFLDSAQFKDATPIPYPVTDSAAFKLALKKRLIEVGVFPLEDSSVADSSLAVMHAIKRYQQKRNLTVDGKAGGETIRSLNLSDKDKFVRIAISLDKYKMLPDSMPQKFLWVNLAGFYLQLWESDSIKMASKVIVGKPLTRSPVLNSAISEMITYPQWTIPESIIAKEVLPGLKKNPDYLEKHGYSLLNSKNEEVDPYFVDWSKYKKGIPYKVIQGSGDANALGVLKFNFPNKYAVYLHDTNQRYLFAQTSRALSHGCVRVQEWQKLANYFLVNDSLRAKAAGNNYFTKADSLSKWLTNKEKHYIPVRERIPLFIRYFTCEGRDGHVVFFDDVYSEDAWLREKYFAGK